MWKALEQRWSAGDHQTYLKHIPHLACWLYAATDLSAEERYRSVRPVVSSFLDKDVHAADDLGRQVEIILPLVNTTLFYKPQDTRMWQEARKHAGVELLLLRRRVKPLLKPESELPVAYMNIAPPPGVSGFSGMAPENIKDPQLRAEYEAALVRNRRNGKIRNAQVDLQVVYKKVERRMEVVLALLYRRLPEALDEYDALLKAAEISPAERARALRFARGEE